MSPRPPAPTQLPPSPFLLLLLLLLFLLRLLSLSSPFLTPTHSTRISWEPDS